MSAFGDDRCAVCRGSRCVHAAGPAGHLVAALTVVSGTPCCGDCMSLLLDAVLVPAAEAVRTAIQAGWDPWRRCALTMADRDILLERLGLPGARTGP